MRRIILLLLFLSLLPIVVSQPPQAVFEGTEGGLNIRTTDFPYITANRDFTAHFHVYNSSNGIILDNNSVSCYLHIYNNSGSHIFKSKPLEFEGVEFEIKLDKANFTNEGLNSYIAWCNTSNFGGYVSETFTITSGGHEPTTYKAIIYIGLIGVLVFLLVIISWVISQLPSKNEYGTEDEIISVSWLKYLRNILWVVNYLIVMTIMFLSSNISFAYLGGGLSANIFFTLYKLMFLMLLPMLFVWFVWIIASFFQDKRFKKYLNDEVYSS